MITNWIERVFGVGGNGRLAPGRAQAGNRDLSASSSTIVDSDEIAAELARARRYERDLTLAVVSAHPDLGTASEDSDGMASRLPQMIALLTAVALRDVVRASDVVCYQAAENRFVLALVESSTSGAHAVVDRVGDHFRRELRLRVRAGAAQFPSDAYTLDELLSVAASRVPPHVVLNGHRPPAADDAARVARRVTDLFQNGDRTRGDQR